MDYVLSTFRIGHLNRRKHQLPITNDTSMSAIACNPKARLLLGNMVTTQRLYEIPEQVREDGGGGRLINRNQNVAGSEILAPPQQPLPHCHPCGGRDLIKLTHEFPGKSIQGTTIYGLRSFHFPDRSPEQKKAPIAINE